MNHFLCMCLSCCEWHTIVSLCETFLDLLSLVQYDRIESHASEQASEELGTRVIMVFSQKVYHVFEILTGSEYNAIACHTLKPPPVCWRAAADEKSSR